MRWRRNGEPRCDNHQLSKRLDNFEVGGWEKEYPSSLLGLAL